MTLRLKVVIIIIIVVVVVVFQGLGLLAFSGSEFIFWNLRIYLDSW
jgi:hypothetical protein